MPLKIPVDSDIFLEAPFVRIKTMHGPVAEKKGALSRRQSPEVSFLSLSRDELMFITGYVLKIS